MNAQAKVLPRLTTHRAAAVWILVLAIVTLLVACSDDRPSPMEPAAASPAQLSEGGASGALLGGGEADGPRVWTNKDDYIPGEMVMMLGVGFHAGETVTLTLHENPKLHNDRSFAVLADSTGAFLFDEFRPEEHDVGVHFTLVAVGQSSGLEAQTTFTDDIVLGPHTEANNGDPGSPEITLQTPTPITAGDFLIAHVTIEGFGTSDVICTPGGWNLRFRTNNSSSVAQAVFWRVATGTDSVSYTLRFRTTSGNCSSATNGRVTGKGAVGGVIAYSGVDTSHSDGPIIASSGGTGSSTTINAPNIANVPAGSRVVRYFGNDKEFEISTSGTGTARVYSARRPKSGGGFEKPSGAAADGPQETTGTTTTVTGSNSGNGGNWVAQTVVLRMAQVTTYQLSVTVVGSGTVTSSPAGIDCGIDCSEDYAEGTEVTLTASAASGWAFDGSTGWSGAGTTNASGQRVVSMSQARSVTATFTQNTHTLSVTVVGSGTVTSNPAGIDCGSGCSEDYAEGTEVTLTAVADAGSTFDSSTGWSGAGTTNASGQRVVSMSQARSVTATFDLAADPDTEGPITSNVVANANPVAHNTAFELSAYVDDTSTGNSNITAAEYSLDGGSTWSSAVPTANPAFDTSPTVTVTWNVPGAAAGVYNLCVRGTDAAGNTGPATCTFLAVYDPSAGFITGGGWIASPADACRTSVCLDEYGESLGITGKANFGFNAKYKKGANKPDGQTQFQFQAGNLNFHSTSYDWLVVAGQDRAKFKGVGTINGQGQYGFMITGIDGSKAADRLDRFRIKIWDMNNGNAVVYDNQLGKSDDGYDATVLGGGSVRIHQEGNQGGGKK